MLFRSDTCFFVPHLRHAIPKNIDWDAIDSIATEARQKFKKINPETIGQASRISGVNPADISILMVYLEGNNKARRKVD